MTVENVPWMIQGGLHSAAAGRRVLNQASGNAEGVAAPGDLRVHQAAVANGTVLVEPGGAIMRSRYPGIKGESYAGQVTATEIVAIAPNGGGATRYDLVIARIDDWNFAGQQATPADLPRDDVPAFKIQVLQGVASNVKTAAQLALGYPAIALARIALPAGTGAVTDAMITPLREVAVPHRQRSLNPLALPAAPTTSLDKTQAQGDMTFPSQAVWTLEVPEWATRARIRFDANSLKMAAGAGVAGYMWVRIGTGTPQAFVTETTAYDPPANSSPVRVDITVAADVAIPAELRGQSVTFEGRGRVIAGTAYLLADGFSNVILDVEFLEAPSEDV